MNNTLIRHLVLKLSEKQEEILKWRIIYKSYPKCKACGNSCQNTSLEEQLCCFCYTIPFVTGNGSLQKHVFAHGCDVCRELDALGIDNHYPVLVRMVRNMVKLVSGN